MSAFDPLISQTLDSTQFRGAERTSSVWSTSALIRSAISSGEKLFTDLVWKGSQNQALRRRTRAIRPNEYEFYSCFVQIVTTITNKKQFWRNGM